jgi:hypothetical protein
MFRCKSWLFFFHALDHDQLLTLLIFLWTAITPPATLGCFYVHYRQNGYENLMWRISCGVSKTEQKECGNTATINMHHTKMVGTTCRQNKFWPIAPATFCRQPSDLHVVEIRWAAQHIKVCKICKGPQQLQKPIETNTETLDTQKQ